MGPQKLVLEIAPGVDSQQNHGRQSREMPTSKASSGQRPLLLQVQRPAF
jgi:hypothetical protein